MQAVSFNAWKVQTPCRERNGPRSSFISIFSPGTKVLQVVNCWLIPALPTLRVARICAGLLSSTSAAEHQGRNCG
ncbi:hypothetical protein D3C72_2433030 [compost metagenome]